MCPWDSEVKVQIKIESSISMSYFYNTKFCITDKFDGIFLKPTDITSEWIPRSFIKQVVTKFMFEALGLHVNRCRM